MNEAATGDARVAWLSLGSNLERPARQVEAAVAALQGAAHTDVLAVSSLYRTTPVGGPPDQPMFCNAAAAIKTGLMPYALLAALQTIEAGQGRVRDVRWGPRTLDLDIIALEGVRSSDPRLTLPHPRAAERAFVLVPLAEIAPALELGEAGRVIDCLDRVAHDDIVAWAGP